MKTFTTTILVSILAMAPAHAQDLSNLWPEFELVEDASAPSDMLETFPMDEPQGLRFVDYPIDSPNATDLFMFARFPTEPGRGLYLVNLEDLLSAYVLPDTLKVDKIEPTGSTLSFLSLTATNVAADVNMLFDVRVIGTTRFQVTADNYSQRSSDNKLTRNYGARTTQPLCTTIYSGSEYFDLDEDTKCICNAGGSWVAIGPGVGPCD
jgi:hypothetical protein